MTRIYNLFATPSFIGGMSHVLDLGSTLTQYNVSASPKQADFWAVSSDWVATGNDIKYAMSQLTMEHNGEEK